MRTMVAIIKHVFVPISAFLFLGIGMLACIYSGVIEYSVLKEMLQVSGGAGEMIRPEFWPFVLVVVLEGAKFTLHFYGASLKNKKTAAQITDMDTEGLGRLITVIKRSLVGFSLLCTVIFVTNSYFQDEGAAAAARVEQSQILAEQEYRQGIEDLEAAKDAEIAKGLARYDNDLNNIDNLERQLNELVDQIKVTLSIKMRGDLQEEANRVRSELRTEKNHYSDNTDAVYEKAQADYDSGVLALNKKYGENGSGVLAADDPRVAAAGDNAFLRVFLNAFCETLFGRPYGRKTYLIWVSIMAVLLAAVLEACISVSQTLLTVSGESFMKILGECTVTGSEKWVVKVASRLIFSIFSLVSAYIVFGMMFHVDLTRTSIVMAAVSYVMVVVLMGISDRMGNASSGREEAGASVPLWRQIAGMIWTSAVPAALAFAGYVFIGFICDGNFVYGDLNGLAIAMGGIFSQFLRQRSAQTV